MANEDGLVRLELDGRSQSVLVRGERHTTAIDYDLRLISDETYNIPLHL